MRWYAYRTVRITRCAGGGRSGGARGAQAEVDLERRLLGHTLGPHHEFAGIPVFKALEAKYLPADELKRKYEGATGL